MAQVEIIETTGCRKKLSVEIENERLDTEIKTTLKKVKNQVQVPGFRKGKAPESILMKRFGDYIREEAVKDMVPKILREVFEEQGIKPVGEPEISDFKYDEAAPITFTVTVEEAPEIDISGFEGLKITKEVQEITEDDVDNYIERIRQMSARRTEVDRASEEGDILVVNLQKLDVSGVPIVGEKMEGHVISLDGQGSPSPEFDSQVTGMKKGEKKTVRFTYDETIENPDLVGKAEAYDVEIVQVVENKVPELNDEFAKTLAGYADVNELREKTNENLTRQYEFNAERKLQTSIINEFVKNNPFEVPNSMVERVIQSEFENAKKSKTDQPFDEDALRTQIRPDAVRAVQAFLIVDTVIKEKEIDAAKEEVSERIEEIAQNSGKPANEVRRDLIKEGRFAAIKDEIIQKKAYDWMIETADITIEKIQHPAAQNIITP